MTESEYRAWKQKLDTVVEEGNQVLFGDKTDIDLVIENKRTITTEEELLQSAIDRMVSEKLNGVVREFGSLTENFDDSKKRQSALTVIKMARDSATRFFNKMETRIEKNSK